MHEDYFGSASPLTALGRLFCGETCFDVKKIEKEALAQNRSEFSRLEPVCHPWLQAIQRDHLPDGEFAKHELWM